jgi:DNA-binding PadR family transcriptional regulator
MDLNSFNIPGPMFGPPKERPFQKGDFKFLILDVLKEKPCYGYEIIRIFEERFHGFYAPSPGVVYPTLQMLEDIGHVTASAESGKKVYSITVEGLLFLKEKGCMEDRNERLSDWDNPPNIREIRKTMREFVRLAEMLKWEIRKMEPDELMRVRDIIVHAYDHIEEIIKKGLPDNLPPEKHPPPDRGEPREGKLSHVRDENI